MIGIFYAIATVLVNAISGIDFENLHISIAKFAIDFFLIDAAMHRLIVMLQNSETKNFFWPYIVKLYHIVRKYGAILIKNIIKYGVIFANNVIKYSVALVKIVINSWVIKALIERLQKKLMP